ncbi:MULTISPECIES: NADPH-dependent FMN reductase [Streptomyces]|uniref:NADPH-dependent FMN reductase n=1 Tax=Streptomyces TaxID=1883 RepID=UPI00163D03CA|nr:MULTISPECIES: NAD(P)H-dependent oxidoreductase [Streptomyces]MBC2875016.1 NAD(P)H-dependent oxidoreductase [Streptomyces sp. TYQ1024]UBI37450.1 NAD(P)H-dependent oxidoreductase [Streptomyces mobaraensis]UKW30041.1 NAD(P)H-dependent oxidoreductase [Streptomyces sp. TYQ1024]
MDTTYTARTTPDPLRIAVLNGSTREGRFGPVVARWVMSRLAERDDMDADLVDLVETPLPTVFPAFGGPAPEGAAELLAAVSPRLAAADGFVIVTPEYNRSFPASLKNAIDWHHREWQAKPVTFVSYGGRSGGLRAVEQLRLVLAELDAATLRDTVSFQLSDGPFDADGRLTDRHAEAAAKAQLDQLAWWAGALRDARRAGPYAAAAA